MVSVYLRASEPVPGVAAVLAARAAVGDDVVYVTNNSMWYRADYVTRLASMGAPVTPDRVVSSARATALYLHDGQPEVEKVLGVGGAGLVHELRDVGIEVVYSGARPDRWNANGRDAASATAWSMRSWWASTSTSATPDLPSPPKPYGRDPDHRHESRSGLSARKGFDARRGVDRGRPLRRHPAERLSPSQARTLLLEVAAMPLAETSPRP